MPATAPRRYRIRDTYLGHVLTAEDHPTREAAQLAADALNRRHAAALNRLRPRDRGSDRPRYAVLTLAVPLD